MNVTFYTFSKRVNSTAQPVSGTDYTVILKEPSSVISPRLDLIWSGTGSPTAFNYAYISDFGRYYWVTNWEYHDRKWTCSLTVDVLASWKTEIGSSSKYILRSASEYDNDVFDSLYPATGGEQMEDVSVSTGWSQDTRNSGCYVLNVSGLNNPANSLGVTLYQQTAAQAQQTIYLAFDDIQNMIAGTSSVTDARTALLWLGQSVINVGVDISKYLNGYMWFPHVFEDPTLTPDNIKLGLLDGGSGIPIKTNSFQIHEPLSLPSWVLLRNKWESCAPFTTYTLEFMPFGTIQLDSVALVNYGGCYVLCDVDAFTGVGVLHVYAGTLAEGPLLAVRTAQVGIPVQFGANKVDLGNAASAVIGGLTQAVKENPIGAISGVLDAAMALVPDAVTCGNMGNITSIGEKIHLWIRSLDHVDMDIPEQGRPICTIKTINTLSGYVLCRDGDISAPATQGELDQIASYLTGGFFYD